MWVAQGGGFANEDEEGGLEGVVDVVRVGEEATADGEHHGAVAVEDDFEGALIAFAGVSLEEVGFAQTDKGAGVEKVVEVGLGAAGRS